MTNKLLINAAIPEGIVSQAPIVIPGKWVKAPRHPTIDVVIPGRTRGSLMVTALHPLSDGTLAVGYGDWNENTGGVTIYSFDPETLTYQQRTDMLKSEAVVRFYTDVEDVTWALFVDGTGYYEEYRAAVPIHGTPSIEVPYAQWLHVFDAIDFDGALWFCGSGWQGGFPEDPVGHGTSGTYLQRIDRSTGHETRYYGPQGAFARFYSMHVVDGSLVFPYQGRNLALREGGESAQKWRDGLVQIRGAFEATDVEIPPTPDVRLPEMSGSGLWPDQISARALHEGHYVVGTYGGDIWVYRRQRVL